MRLRSNKSSFLRATDCSPHHQASLGHTARFRFRFRWRVVIAAAAVLLRASAVLEINNWHEQCWEQ
jgi:hypothetical protein